MVLTALQELIHFSFPRYIATTFSAAAYARRIFPCFDEPALKATFRLKVGCRNNLMTVANTKAVNVIYWDE